MVKNIFLLEFMLSIVQIKMVI